MPTALPVAFARPREAYRLKAQPAFGALAFHVWGLLRDEVMRAREIEGETSATTAGAGSTSLPGAWR